MLAQNSRTKRNRINDVITHQDEDFQRSRTYQIELHFKHLDSLNAYSLHPLPDTSKD